MPSLDKILKLAKEHKTDLILFGASGLLAFVADYTTLQVVDKTSHNLLLATTAGILVGFVISYGLNHLRFKVRHDQAKPVGKSLPVFFLLFLFNTGFTFVCLDYNNKHHIAPRLIIKMGTVGLIMVWNYVLFHLYVFRGNAKTNQDGV